MPISPSEESSTKARSVSDLSSTELMAYAHRFEALAKQAELLEQASLPPKWPHNQKLTHRVSVGINKMTGTDYPTLSELASYTEVEWNSYANFGKKSMAELRALLQPYGVDIGSTYWKRGR